MSGILGALLLFVAAWAVILGAACLAVAIA